MRFGKPWSGLALLSLLAGFVGASFAGDASAGGKHDVPSSDAVLTAADTTTLMANTVIAALIQEINETTPANAALGSHSISLIFDDHNDNMRLVGEMSPLSDNDYPADDFEEDALTDALAGTPRTGVDFVKGKWYYRTSIPLSNFVPQCAMCHSNFEGIPASDHVGALMLRVPIEE